MGKEELDLISVRVKSANGPLLRAFVIGTFTVCSTVIGAAVYIKTTFNNHELRISVMERKWDKFEDKLLTKK